MKVPIHIAEKLFRLSQGENIPSSLAKHALIEDLISEGILERNGRIKKTLRVQDNKALDNYLKNKCSISDLSRYIETCTKENITRSELVSASSNSKLWRVRTFKGFLINCYSPIQATLHNKHITLNPIDGTFQFIYDFEKLIPSADVTIVGIENPENFRHINKQKYLFKDIKPLFVSRYPLNQSKDLIKWLQSIPNKYIHFGDFDFAGIGIYLNELKKHINDRAAFFIPDDIETRIMQNGSKERYDNQKINFDSDSITEPRILKLIATIHKIKKGLDQEIFIDE